MTDAEPIDVIMVRENSHELLRSEEKDMQPLNSLPPPSLGARILFYGLQPAILLGVISIWLMDPANANTYLLVLLMVQVVLGLAEHFSLHVQSGSRRYVSSCVTLSLSQCLCLSPAPSVRFTTFPSRRHWPRSELNRIWIFGRTVGR